MLTHSNIRIGDRARFPLGRLGDDETYRHTFEAIAFTRSGVMTRRLADGVTREVSLHWWERYTLDERPRPAPTPLRRLPLPRLNTDRSLPGFYVSIRDNGSERYILAAGPFSYDGDSLRCLRAVWAHLRAHYPGYVDGFGRVSVGTCKASNGIVDGKFNEALGLS